MSKLVLNSLGSVSKLTSVGMENSLVSNNGLQMCVLLACFSRENNLLIYGNGQSALHLIFSPSCSPFCSFLTSHDQHHHSLEAQWRFNNASNHWPTREVCRVNQKSSNFFRLELQFAYGKDLEGHLKTESEIVGLYIKRLD